MYEHPAVLLLQENKPMFCYLMYILIGCHNFQPHAPIGLQYSLCACVLVISHIVQFEDKRETYKWGF